MLARRRTLALALPVALILGLGACSSDDGAPATPSAAPTSEAPSATPTAEPSETPEPEPTETGPTPPPRPAAMDDTGKKGAQAAAEYFIELVGYGLHSGDSTPLAEMKFSEMCTTCQSFIDSSETYAARDDTVTGGDIELSEFTVSDRDSLTGGYAVSAAFKMDEMIITGPDNETVEKFKSDDGYLQIDVVHDEETWMVMAMTTDQGQAE